MSRSHLPSVWLFTIASLGAGCDTATSPASPSGVPLDASASLGATASSAAPGILALRRGRPEKIRLCHLTAHARYVPITVPEPAVPAHLAHGDGEADDSNFDGNCRPLGPSEDPPVDPIPLTLWCGAPAGATHPGGAESPGPDVDTSTGGVDLEFAVSVSPPPSVDTWITKETYDTYATGVQSLPPSPFLVPDDGTYEGSVFVSGQQSLVRELRFVLGETATCSLFWNINPAGE